MLTTTPTTLSLAIAGMTCGHCVSRVTRALSGISGLQVVDVTVGAATVRLTDPTAVNQAITNLNDLGYTATLSNETAPKARCQCCH